MYHHITLFRIEELNTKLYRTKFQSYQNHVKPAQVFSVYPQIMCFSCMKSTEQKGRNQCPEQMRLQGCCNKVVFTPRNIHNVQQKILQYEQCIGIAVRES